MSGLHDLLLSVIHRIVELKHVIRETYRVNPLIFMALYSGSGPLFYYALYRIARAVRRTLYREMNVWLGVVLASTAAPFVYVLAVGRNVPWWAYAALVVLLLQGVVPMIRRLTRTAAPAVACAVDDTRLPPMRVRIDRTGGRLCDRYRSFSRTMARVAHSCHRPRHRRARSFAGARSRALAFASRRATNNGYRSLRLVINRSRGRTAARFGYIAGEGARLRAG